MMDDDRSLEGSTTSSLTSFSVPAGGFRPAAVEEVAAVPTPSEIGVSVGASSVSSFSTLQPEAISGGVVAVAGAAAAAAEKSRSTRRTAFPASSMVSATGNGRIAPVLAAGENGGEVAEDGAAARGRGSDRDGQTKARKKRRGDGDGGGAQRVHKINLGSKRNQLVRLFGNWCVTLVIMLVGVLQGTFFRDAGSSASFGYAMP